MHCNWCNNKDFRAQVCSVEFPVICKDCGTKLGYIDWEALNYILIERDYYKKEFYKKALTKKKE